MYLQTIVSILFCGFFLHEYPFKIDKCILSFFVIFNYRTPGIVWTCMLQHLRKFGAGVDQPCSSKRGMSCTNWKELRDL